MTATTILPPPSLSLSLQCPFCNKPFLYKAHLANPHLGHLLTFKFPHRRENGGGCHCRCCEIRRFRSRVHYYRVTQHLGINCHQFSANHSLLTWEGSIHRILKKIPAMNFSLSPCNLVRCYKSAPARFRISFGSFRHLASQKWERSCVRTGMQVCSKYRTPSDREGGRAIWNARGRAASLSPSSSLACKLFGMGKSSFSSLPYSIPQSVRTQFEGAGALFRRLDSSKSDGAFTSFRLARRRPQSNLLVRNLSHIS